MVEPMDQSCDSTSHANGGAEPSELGPATYPPMGEDAETPWLPSDPIPNPEPEAPGLEMPDPGVYEGKV